MTRVSVMMPVYNEAPFLRAAIESILAQTHPEFELLIQDDGSTDESLAIANSYAAHDARISIDSGEHKDIIATANRLLVRAQGDLLIRMDGDDVAHPSRVEALVHAADASPDIDYFAHGIRYIPRDRLSEGMEAYEGWINGLHTHDAIMASRFIECVMPNPACAFRRTLADALGGYVDSPFPEDYEFFLRAAGHGARFQKLPDVLLDWRDHDARHSRLDGRYAQRQFRDLKLKHLIPMLRACTRPIDVIGYGREGKKWCNAFTTAGINIANIYAYRESRVGATIHGHTLKAFAPSELNSSHFSVSTLGGQGREDIRAVTRAAGLREPENLLFVC